MRKLMLGVVLGGLLLAVAGCGGGGGGSSSGGSGEEIILPDGGSTTHNTTSSINVNTAGKQLTPELYYAATNSSGDAIMMEITSIELDSSSKKLTINCSWTATNKSGCAQIVKLSDAGKKNFYMKDNNGTLYYHNSGTGAAYTQAILSSSPVTGSYTFPASAVFSGVTQIYFCDKDYGVTLGPVTVAN